MRMVAAAVSLVLVVVGSAQAGNAMPEVEERILTDEELGRELLQMEECISSKQYAKAWAVGMRLVAGNPLGATARSEAMTSLARLVIASPELRKDGKQRLDLLRAWLPRLLAEANDPSAVKHRVRTWYPVFSEVCYTLSCAALRCDEIETSNALLGTACSYAKKADFSAHKEAISGRQVLVRGMIRRLVVQHKADEAQTLLEKQWGFLNGGTLRSAESVKGLAALEVANLLEGQNDVAAAASRFLLAKERLERGLKEEVGEDKALILRARRLAQKGLSRHREWVIPVKRAVYADPSTLRAAIERVARAYASAVSRGDLEAALKVVANPREGKDRLSQIVAEVKRLRIKAIGYSGFHIGPVTAQARSVSCVCTVSIAYEDGSEESGTKTLTFVLSGGEWKINPRF